MTKRNIFSELINRRRQLLPLFKLIVDARATCEAWKLPVELLDEMAPIQASLERLLRLPSGNLYSEFATEMYADFARSDGQDMPALWAEMSPAFLAFKSFTRQAGIGVFVKHFPTIVPLLHRNLLPSANDEATRFKILQFLVELLQNTGVDNKWRDA